MTVVVGRNRLAGAAALATLAGVLGSLALPRAQASHASESSRPRPVAPAWQREVSWSRSVSRAGFGAIPARSLWRPGGLARGGLPSVTVPALGAARGGWTLQPMPNPATQRNAFLAADSCPAAGTCTAVGSYVNAAGAVVTLAERRRGSSWKTQRTPVIGGAVDSQFTGVSCAAAKSCVAVGYYLSRTGHVVLFAERWNGATWRVLRTRAIGQDSGFFAVSCTSATACTAVGTYSPNPAISLTLAERWNGTRWKIQPTPRRVKAVTSTLLGVSCSRPKACAAVGASAGNSGASTPLAMGWNGGAWTLQTAPAPDGSQGSGLSAVACTAAAACTAAGSYDTISGSSVSLAERRTGRRWRIQFVPSPAGATFSELLAVSCVSAKACTAGGAYAPPGSNKPLVTLAEAWKGSSWRVQATPNPARTAGDGFAGLSCVTSGACAAVGSYGTATTLADLALAEARNGNRWKMQASASPAGANPSQLSSDSCVTARDCVAVGGYAKNATTGNTLAETWNGSRWRIEATPNPAGQVFSAFNAISCATARSCVAVGEEFAKGALNPAAMAETWNGAKWTVRNVPQPANNGGVALTGVSCTAPNACTAVGAYFTRSVKQVALAERWNGSAWTMQKLPVATKQTLFEAVSCTSASACIAVGNTDGGSGNVQPLAEAWDGSSWAAQSLPMPKGDPGGILSAVSCSAAMDCTATGAGFAASGQPLAERWNGTSWAAQTTVPPPGFQASVTAIALIGVSCSSAGACTAVGSYQPNMRQETFGEGWHGAKWHLQPTATPIGSQESILSGLSCPVPRCIAVGADLGISGIPVTMAESRPA